MTLSPEPPAQLSSYLDMKTVADMHVEYSK